MALRDYIGRTIPSNRRNFDIGLARWPLRPVHSLQHMDLDEPSIEFKPVIDKRPLMPEPPPVSLVAVEDVHLPAPAGLETQLDGFYAGLLKFEREDAEQGQIAYKAANFRIRIEVMESPADRQDFRPTGIDVPSLGLLERELIDREIEYEWQKGLTPGNETLLLRDPAGNWVQIGQIKVV